MKATTFLTAEWRHLLMLNYVVDPALLRNRVPAGTELDYYCGQTFVSVVGFRFLNTRVFGCAFPFHKDFEEVNLRFYVRRRVGDGWRRGVVFIREIVPCLAVSLVARVCYGEPYVTLPTRHRIDLGNQYGLVHYSWKRNGNWESIQGSAHTELEPLQSGTMQEFIAEHYWGYSQCGRQSREYEVEHPRWNVANVRNAQLSADIATLYGAEFVDPLSSPPISAFIADGSAIIVRGSAKFTSVNLP